MVGDYGHTWRRLLMGVTGAPGGRLSEMDAVPGTRLQRVTRLLFALVSLVALFAVPTLADAESVSLAPPIRVAGADDLVGVACSSATSCVAVGTNASGVGTVVPITNGAPGAATAVAGTSLLSGVACSRATSCVAVGRNATRGVVVPITNGIPGTPRPVAGINGLEGVACSSANRCVAVGDAGVGVAVAITNGAPGPVTPVAGTALLGAVACPSAISCVAVGANESVVAVENARVGGLVGVVVPITNGAPGAVTPVAGTGDLGGVACSSATSCVAVGTNVVADNASNAGVVVPITNETPGISSYRLTNNPFAVAGRATPKSGSTAKTSKHKQGTTFRYTLSEAATVKILIAQRRAGRRKHKRCVTPPRRLRHARKCTRIFVKGTLTRVSRLGANSVAFSGRIGSKAFRPGTYQATLTATDPAKNTSTAQTILFQIAKH